MLRMWKAVGPCILTAAVLTSPTRLPAQAQQPTLQGLVQTPQYQANIARLFASLPSDVFQRCPSLVSKGSSVDIIRPATFSTDGKPSSGAWRQNFPVSGCGNDTTIHIYVMAQPDGKFASVIAVPGDTHADLVLQRDALGYIATAVRTKIATCETPHVRTTRFDGPLAPSAAIPNVPADANGWRETWTVAACGQNFDVPLTFVHEATGVRIVVNLTGMKPLR